MIHNNKEFDPGTLVWFVPGVLAATYDNDVYRGYRNIITEEMVSLAARCCEPMVVVNGGPNGIYVVTKSGSPLGRVERFSWPSFVFTSLENGETPTLDSVFY